MAKFIAQITSLRFVVTVVTVQIRTQLELVRTSASICGDVRDVIDISMIRVRICVGMVAFYLMQIDRLWQAIMHNEGLCFVIVVVGVSMALCLTVADVEFFVCIVATGVIIVVVVVVRAVVVARQRGEDDDHSHVWQFTAQLHRSEVVIELMSVLVATMTSQNNHHHNDNIVINNNNNNCYYF